MDQGVVDEWLNQLEALTLRYDPDDIWNCDETGLYYRGLPNRSLCTKDDDGKNVKLLKDRLTILLTTSATGERLHPFIVGKSKIVGSWNHLKSLIIRRSVPELLALLPDFDHTLNEEIRQNPSNTIQTSISQYSIFDSLVSERVVVVQRKDNSLILHHLERYLTDPPSTENLPYPNETGVHRGVRLREVLL